jgi:hypothetical protein
MPMPTGAVDFVDGLFTMAGNGSPAAQHGVGVHLYAANRDMEGRYFYDADGELLIVPQQGRLHIETELGVLDVEPQEIALIPRGIRFRVALPDGEARGYVCENFGALVRLAGPGPIGSNGLANPRDFQTPNACVRRARRRLRTHREVPGPPAGAPTSAIRRSTSSRGMATTRRANTICAVSTRSVRSASTIPIRRSSPCSPRPATRPAPRTWTSWCSRRVAGRAGHVPARRGSIATSPANSWAW